MAKAQPCLPLPNHHISRSPPAPCKRANASATTSTKPHSSQPGRPANQPTRPSLLEPKTRSSKLRGAMAKMSASSSASKGGRLITASSGNHGIGTAFATRSLDKDLTVVLTESVVPSKLEKIKALGVDVILHGAETGLAEQHAQHLASTGQYTYISPYNDFDVISGQGTIALELLEQCDKVDNIFISMGGGGLISGIGSVLKAFSPHTKI
ncbi:hypothetical protein D6C91_05482 [Aureobasidium pullulans]|uniref:Tryptophan synthase beta chain-like PALP domain-containing protein n=1 Tax=Aureobasidium pullulans TaxID=5580 RepID=A0A4S9T4J9_AURPU|nr:hypothetical protein D6C91_05482 [Aureobasidium pullulans]